MSANIPCFPPDIAMLVIRECKAQGVPIYGIDAVKITDTYTQPYMEHSIDYTAFPYTNAILDATWEDAIQFIESKTHLGLYFEIVIPYKV